MSFVETQFPTNISLGAIGGPGFSTDVVTLASGDEQRNINWTAARRRYSVGHAIQDRIEFDDLIAFFTARRGKGVGFRFKDWSDYSVTDQEIGIGDAAETDFQLIKTYSSGGVEIDRTITKPVTGTLTIYFDDVEQVSGWTVDTTTGIVTFSSAPGGSVVITADFEFDVPCRFDQDDMQLTMHTQELGSWPQIDIVELRT